MAIKWGSTVCTVIKWGSTVCSQVKWGSTVVFPDVSGAAIYSYGNNPFNCSIGNSWNSSTYISYINTNECSMTLNSTNISISTGDGSGRCLIAAPNNYTNTWFKNTTKIKIVCSLNISTSSSRYYAYPSIEVGTVKYNTIGYTALNNCYIQRDGNTRGNTSNASTWAASSSYPMTWTGGTYNFNGTWDNDTTYTRFIIRIDINGAYAVFSGTISEIVLMS